MLEADRTPKKPNSPPNPVIISWSGLKRWENCPQHHLRVIKKETEKAEKGRIFLPGTVTDLTQRQWLDSENPQPGEMEQMVTSVFDRVVAEGESKIHWKGDPRKDQEAVKALCREAVRNLEPWLLRNVIPYDYQAEVKFRANMLIPYICEEGTRAPVRMIGGIDIVVRHDNGKFRLYDLKTSKNAGYLRSTLGQLTFYDIAWGVIQENFNHADEWGFVTPLLDEKIIPVLVGHEERRQMMSRIVKYAQGVWQDAWDPKADDTGCDWCEARKTCEKFKLVPIQESNGNQRISFAQAASQRTRFREETPS